MLGSCSIKPVNSAAVVFQSMHFHCETLVYVVDRSPSMRFRLSGTVSPLIKSVSFLGKDRPFQVIYTDKTRPQVISKATDASGWIELIPATSESIRTATKFIRFRRVEAASETDAVEMIDTLLPAMKQALSLAKGKTTIVLISDASGDNIDQILQQVSAMNKPKKASICTVLVGRASQRAVTAMHTLATSNKGKFLYMAPEKLRANRNLSGYSGPPSNPFNCTSRRRGHDGAIRIDMNKTHRVLAYVEYPGGVTVTRKRMILTQYEKLIATLKIARPKMDEVSQEEAAIWVKGTSLMASRLSKISKKNRTNKTYSRLDTSGTEGATKKALVDRCIKEFENQYAHAKKLRIENATSNSSSSRRRR